MRLADGVSCRELQALYDQYLDSRSRYFYFREKLEKEMMARARDPFSAAAAAAAQPAQYAAAATQPGYGAPNDPYQQAQAAAAAGANQSLVR